MASTPLIGFSHADRDGRASLVYDAMELRRADVDDLVLRFLTEHTFRRGDVERQADGSVRLSAALVQVICLACRVDDATLCTDADWLARLVAGEESKGEVAEKTHRDMRRARRKATA